MEWEILGRYCWLLELSEPTSEETARAKGLMAKSQNNPGLKQDPIVLWGTAVTKSVMDTGCMAFAFNDGRIVTDSDIHVHQLWCRDVGIPLLRKARDQSVGARREWHEMTKNVILVCIGGFAQHHSTRENTGLIHELTAADWEDDSSGLVSSLSAMSFKRHHVIGKWAVRFPHA